MRINLLALALFPALLSPACSNRGVILITGEPEPSDTDTEPILTEDSDDLPGAPEPTDSPEPADTDPITLVDQDGDGYAVNDPAPEWVDCDDSNLSIFPGAEDSEDRLGVDQNCDGVDGVDFDQDGEASVETGGEDCDDSDSSIPGAEIAHDGLDNDCDSSTLDEDFDGDGWVYNHPMSGAPSPLFVPNDCNDLDPNVYPDQIEDNSNGIDDNCDGNVDEFAVDINTAWCESAAGSSIAVTVEVMDSPFSGGTVNYIKPGAVNPNIATPHGLSLGLQKNEFNSDCDPELGLWFWKFQGTCYVWGAQEPQMNLSGCRTVIWEDLSL